jgi:hypothetical protein
MEQIYLHLTPQFAKNLIHNKTIDRSIGHLDAANGNIIYFLLLAQNSETELAPMLQNQ